MLILGSDILANRHTIDPVLENNSWAAIDGICKAGAIPTSWLYGTKEFTGTDGNTYHLRLSDKQAERYEFADGSKSHAVFELVECIPTSYRMNVRDTNAGGFGTSEMLTTLNNTVIDILPNEIKSLLKTTKVKADNGGGSYYSAIVDVECKLFLPAAREVGLTTSSREGEGTTFDYYTNYTSGTYRKKAKVTTPTNYATWFLRSSWSSDTARFCSVDQSGSVYFEAATTAESVSFCFAL